MRTLADGARVEALIDALGGAISRDMARARGAAPWALIGLRSRGDVLARRLAARLDSEAVGRRVGTLDITLYRDDLADGGGRPVVRTTEVPFGVDGLHVVLTDDVIMSGRSVRAALQSLLDLGRPRRVWLAVLVDRGGRELPIAPDYVGLDCSGGASGEHVCRVEPGDLVEVRLRPTDAEDTIVVRPGSPGASTLPSLATEATPARPSRSVGGGA